jgi:hypothetical protein
MFDFSPVVIGISRIVPGWEELDGRMEHFIGSSGIHYEFTASLPFVVGFFYYY